MSRLIGDYCESPYLSLVPRRGEGSIVAGRDLSAPIIKNCPLTAQCFEYGHAAAHGPFDRRRTPSPTETSVAQRCEGACNVPAVHSDLPI